MTTTTNVEDQPVQDEAPAWARYTNVPFRLLGYGMLMSWHFLLIYFLAIPAETSAVLNILFVRQMALNSSLALAFALIVVLGSRAEFPARLLSMPVVLGVAAVGALSTAGALYASFFDGFAALMALTAVAGAAEALLLLAWLHFYSESSTNYAMQYIALSMVIGALVSFFIRHLTIEIALGCFIALPVLSAVMLVSSVSQTPARSAVSGERGLSDHRGALRPLLTNTAYLVVYSALFGFLQGSVLPDGLPLLAAFTPNTVLGAGLAGALAMFVFHKVPGKRAPEMLRRLSLLLFVAGILLTAYPWPAAKEFAGMTIMTGFITADIACLTFVVRLIRAYDLNSAFAIGLNRAAEYAAFALGIVCGSLLAKEWGGEGLYALAVSGAAALIALGYTLAAMGQGPLDWLNQLYPVQRDARWESDEAPSGREEHADGNPDGADARAHEPTVGRFKTKCRLVCLESGLSPRESEVFMLMAKGRNAEYIQGALTISNYTAKTHIANIYRKVGVHSLQELIDTVEQASVERPDDGMV